MRSWGTVLLGCAVLAGCSGLPRFSDSGEGIGPALSAAQRVMVPGPGRVQLGANSFLRLGPDRVFIPADEGGRLLRAMGEGQRPQLLGVVVAGAPSGADYAAIYARAPRAGFPDFEVVGWRPAPALAGLVPH